MQWVDAHTLDLLSDLMRPPDSPGLFLILSSRPEGVGALERLIRETQIETTETVDLAPLAEETAIVLATRLLGPDDARLARRVAAEAAGNPFFIGQLAHFLQSVDSAQVGEIGLDELLAQRIAGLSETARRVIELVAVAGEPVTRRVLARSAALAPAELTREIGVLRTLNFLRSRGMRMTDEVEVFHDRVRHAAAGAQLDLEEAIGSWMPALKTYHLQHYWRLYSGCERELYRGDANAAAALVAADLPLLERSLLLRVGFIHAEVLHFRGRIALACGAMAPALERSRYAREARRYARKLRRLRLPLARAFEPLLEAGAANLRGEDERSVAALRRAVEVLSKLESLLLASAARRRLGEILGGAEGATLVGVADSWMESQGVKNPARMSAMIVPGSIQADQL